MNLPNALSLFRVILAPIFACVYFSPLPNAHLWALAVFLLAGATDVLDGYLARTYNQITLLGRILDPLADKLMVATALTCMAITGIIPFVIVGIYVAKELLLILGAFLLFRRIKDTPASNVWGKIGTVLFYAAVVAGIAQLQPPFVGALFALAITVMLIAMFSYIRKGWTLAHPDPNAEASSRNRD